MKRLTLENFVHNPVFIHVVAYGELTQTEKKEYCRLFSQVVRFQLHTNAF